MYRPKKEAVEGRQLKVQELSIPFVIVGHATPASKSISCDEPSILFIKTEGLSQVSAAAGCLDAGEATPTFSLTASDANGRINLVVKIGEAVKKVVSASISDRGAGVAQVCYIDVAPLSANGDKICLDADLSTDLSAANTADMVLTVRYIV